MAENNQSSNDDTKEQNAQNNTSNAQGTTNVVAKEDERLEGIKFPYYQSKEVIIKRRAKMAVLQGADPEDTREFIGSSFKGYSVNRGLTKVEERRWLPSMLGLDLEGREWEKGSEEYWNNIRREVPPNGKDDLGGLKLEIGLLYENDGTMSAKEKYLRDLDALRNIDGVIINPAGEPINLTDYILWRYCLVYVDVANDISLVNNSPKIRFYMFTKEKQISDKKSVIDKRRAANQLYNQNISDRNWVLHMLYTLVPGDKDARIQLKDISNLDPEEQDVMLYEYLEKDSAKFMDIGKDKNLAMRSLIELAVATGRMHRIPNTATIIYDGATIGNTTEEVVSFLNNPKLGGEIVRALKAQINTAP